MGRWQEGVFRVPSEDKEAVPTETYGKLTRALENAIKHIEVVDNRYLSGVTLTANLDEDGNVCKEETGIYLTISAR